MHACIHIHILSPSLSPLPLRGVEMKKRNKRNEVKFNQLTGSHAAGCRPAPPPVYTPEHNGSPGLS